MIEAVTRAKCFDLVGLKGDGVVLIYWDLNEENHTEYIHEWTALIYLPRRTVSRKATPSFVSVWDLYRQCPLVRPINGAVDRCCEFMCAVEGISKFG
jgi:hypothetical protein